MVGESTMELQSYFRNCFHHWRPSACDRVVRRL